MKTKDLSAHVNVTVSASEVASFARKWPCSGFLYGDRVTFQFEKKTGDLVAIWFNDRETVPARVDDSAMLALSHYAQEFAGLN